MKKTALILGATGLVGEACVKELLASFTYEKVIALTRKKHEIHNHKYENIVVDFDKAHDVVVKADDVYCAIGTTIAKAGSQTAFRKVDFEIPLAVAIAAKQSGAKKFILVSSLGADADSTVFYSRIKGELENALTELNFESLIIFRPSILLGDRKERRYGEEVGKFVAEKFSFLFSGPLRKYRGTPAGLLARVMVAQGLEKTEGKRIIENDEIFELAKKHPHV